MIAIFSRIKMNRKQFIAVVIFILISTIAQMMIPTLVSKMINDGVNDSNTQMIYTLAISMIVLAVVACVLSIVASSISSSLSTRFCADLRREIFHKIESFSAAEIDRFGSSSLITRNTTDVTQMQTFLSLVFRVGLMAPMMLVVGIIMCVTVAGKVSIVLVVAVPILILAIAILTVAASRYSVKLRNMNDVINQLFLETLEGVRVIRAFNRQKHEIDRFQETNEETAMISNKSVTRSGALMPIIQALFGFTSVGAMVVGMILVVNGEMNVGTLVAAVQYISVILVGIILLSVVIGMFPDTYACMKRIGEVLEAESSITDPKGEMPAQTCKNTVEFRNVSFAYPGASEAVIKGISFVSGPGETTAIIGRTGCGKSSIVKLIPRLYDTSVGEILVDGVNVRDYKQEDLRNLIGYVPQKNVLFSGDIATNLNFGKEDGTEEDWKEAVRIACATEFVEQKDGTYHSGVSQGGTNFSGGQRQRLAIARAVMKKPEVYIFDDSFSALDMKTDKQLRQNLKESMGETTMIVVAQRVNTIMDATRILVLENGEVVGCGTHKELLKTCQLYREIAEIQLGEEEVKNELESA